MTTRGTNPSISPPVQIQPKHVSTITSGTPPPSQQFYPGQSPGFVQGPTFNYIPQQYPQGEQLLPYQAYGSAPNELRGTATTTGRGGAGPTNMAQSGASFYHQPNQNMRPTQPPPPSHPQQYYIGQHGQNAMRHPRPSHASNPAMFIIPQPPNNMVIQAGMYQPPARMPATIYTQGGPQYRPRYQGQPGIVYYGNGARAPAPRRGSQREKHVIDIRDPNTGRNIILQSQEEANNIRKNFTRQVVERMKTGESPSPSHSSVEAVNPPPQAANPSAHNQPSQDHSQMTSYPPGPTQQPQANPPLVGTSVPGAMMQPPAMRLPNPAINLSVPPPPMPPNMVYSNPRHAPSPQAMPGQVQANMPVQQQPSQQVAPPKGPPPTPAPAVVVADSPSLSRPESSMPPSQEAPVSDVKPPSSQPEPVFPVTDIPSPVQPTPAVSQVDHVDMPPSVKAQPPFVHEPAVSTPAQEASTPTLVSPVPLAAEKATVPVCTAAVSTAPAAVSTTPVAVPATVPLQPTVTPAAEEQQPPVTQIEKPVIDAGKPPVAESDAKQPEKEVTSGASIQVKDGRKGKKNKKDFSRKESGGSEMDAFIDGKDSGVDSEAAPSVQENTSPIETDATSLSNAEQTATEKEANLTIPTVAVNSPEEEEVHDKIADQFVAEKEPGVVKSESENNEKTELPHEKDSTASVPQEANLVNSVSELPEEKPDDEQAELENQPPPEENGTPKFEEAEISKAESFAKLKKSGGKLVYDRAYLIELRDCVSSQMKPDGLPALEVILDKPDPLLSRPSGGLADFTPAFFQQGANRHAPPISKSSSRGRPRPGDMATTPRVIKSISMSSEIKPLHQAEKPWKSSKKEVKTEARTLEGDMLFIMNRLTPTNFDKMATEMKALDIKTYDDLKFMVKVFFDKVTIETKFVEAYAQLCKVMSSLKVPPPTDGSVKDSMSTFRVVMLTKCQEEFEADKSVVFEDPEEKRKKLEAEDPEKTPQRDGRIDQVLYHMKLKRMKFYGNIRFIGELYKLNMLTENIMHDCIFRLLKARDDDSLVSLCNLLTTVGRNLDVDKAKPRMDQYFSQMTRIADERKSRIKFTLKDVIDLRSNNWVPRKEATGPKKIDEVHKDFAQEQARNQYLASQPLPPRNDNSQAGSRRGSRQRPDERPNEDGWNTVSSKSVRMIDASKMKISKAVVVDDNVQLGPGGGAHRQTIWSRGSHGGAQPSQDDRQPVGSNRFSALTSDDNRRSFPRSPSRGEGSAGRSLRQGPTAGHGRGKIIARSSQEGDRRSAIANARSFMGGRSQNSSRDNSWNRDDRRQPMGPRSSWDRDGPMTRSDSAVRTEEFKAPAPVRPAVKQMGESEIETKATNLLDEYLNVKDLAEAKLCAKELIGQEHIHLMICACINSVLERRGDARNMTGRLLHELVSSNIISADVYTRGLNAVLEYASDMVVDIPTLWDCLAELICPLLIGGSLQWPKLKQALTPHLDNKLGAKLLAAVVALCAKQQGEKEVAYQWQNSTLSWKAYLKPDEYDDFMKFSKMEFTTIAVAGGVENLSKLEGMIQSGSSVQDMVAFVEKTVPGSKTDPSFIRGLTTVVVSAAVTEKKNVNEEVLKQSKDLLQRYVTSKVDLQLQALYALQALMTKLEHPSGALSKLFDFFYNELSIEEEAFYKWEKCVHPQETEGKGPCLLSVRQFFIWLRENEEPES